MIKASQIESIISEKLAEDNMFIVEVSVHPGNKIVVVIDSNNGVPISYCIEVSRLIEGNFDREVEDFELEVSSAGIGQPFRVKKQYEKNIGREIEVLENTGKKITGKLVSVNEDSFVVETEEMIKPEGKKRKELHVSELSYRYEDVKQVKDIISF